MKDDNAEIAIMEQQIAEITDQISRVQGTVYILRQKALYLRNQSIFNILRWDEDMIVPSSDGPMFILID